MKPSTGICLITIEELTFLLDERFDKLKALLKTTTIENSQQKDELMTRKQAIEFLKISYPTLHNWTNRKVIKSFGIGGRVYYSRQELQKFIG